MSTASKDPVHSEPEKFEIDRNFLSTVRPIFQTYPSRQLNFSKMLFKPEEMENDFAFKCRQKTLQRTELIETDEVVKIL